MNRDTINQICGGRTPAQAVSILANHEELTEVVGHHLEMCEYGYVKDLIDACDGKHPWVNPFNVHEYINGFEWSVDATDEGICSYVHANVDLHASVPQLLRLFYIEATDKERQDNRLVAERVNTRDGVEAFKGYHIACGRVIDLMREALEAIELLKAEGYDDFEPERIRYLMEDVNRDRQSFTCEELSDEDYFKRIEACCTIHKIITQEA